MSNKDAPFRILFLYSSYWALNVEMNMRKQNCKLIPIDNSENIYILTQFMQAPNRMTAGAL